MHTFSARCQNMLNLADAPILLLRFNVCSYFWIKNRILHHAFIQNAFFNKIIKFPDWNSVYPTIKSGGTTEN